MDRKYQFEIENKARTLLLSDNISKHSVSKVINDIIEISESDELLKEQYGDKYIVNPIKLYINSFGGSTYDGLALVDIIRNSTTPVETYCFGSAMSMGFWIWLYGTKRYVGENSTLMYHEVACFIWDKLEGIKIEVKELERLQTLFDNRIKEISLITQDKLNEYRTTKSEWYIIPKEAIQYQLATGII